MINLEPILEMDVVAYGVETEAQKGILCHLPYDNFQGYLFSRLVSGTEIPSFLEQAYIAKKGCCLKRKHSQSIHYQQYLALWMTQNCSSCHFRKNPGCLRRCCRRTIQGKGLFPEIQ